jgi:hypothetical protein
MGKLKVCKTLADRYRNRRHFGLRVHLLAGLSNLDLNC